MIRPLPDPMELMRGWLQRQGPLGKRWPLSSLSLWVGRRSPELVQMNASKSLQPKAVPPAPAHAKPLMLPSCEQSCSMW